MITIFKKDYKDEGGTDGEIRIGWATWDKGEYKKRSIKWAYPKGGKISRGSPEVPFDNLVEMVLFAMEKGELTQEQINKLRNALREQ